MTAQGLLLQPNLWSLIVSLWTEKQVSAGIFKSYVEKEVLQFQTEDYRCVSQRLNSAEFDELYEIRWHTSKIPVHYSESDLAV